MKLSSIVSTVAVVGLLVTGVSFASANPYMGHNGNGRAMTQLSSDQQDQLREMREDNDTKMRPIYSELRAKRLELNALSNNVNTNPKDISKRVKEITTLNSKIENNNIAFSKKVESKLGIEYSGYGHRMGNRGGYGRHNGGYGRHNGGYGGHNGGNGGYGGHNRGGHSRY